MTKTWYLKFAATVVIAGLALPGCGMKTPGVRMCEKTIKETGVKKDCKDEYNRQSEIERKMMDSMGKVVMEECGGMKGKEYEACYNAAALKGMGKQLKDDTQQVIDKAKKNINESTKGMRKNMKDMREDIKDNMK